MRYPFGMVVVPTLLSIFALSLLASPGLAYREYFTPEQRTQLEKIQTIFVDVLTLADKGTMDSAPLVDTVAQRLAEAGYSTVRTAGQAHDVVLRVKCEQYKTWEGTAVTGGDADLPDAPSRQILRLRVMHDCGIGKHGTDPFSLGWSMLRTSLSSPERL